MIRKRKAVRTRGSGALARRVRAFVRVSSIAYLCADRELFGKVWFSYLQRKGIPCRIRVRSKPSRQRRGRVVQASAVVPAGCLNQHVGVTGARLIWGSAGMSWDALRVGVVIVISERETESAITAYARRWKSRRCSGASRRAALFERTHVTDPSGSRSAGAAWRWPSAGHTWLASG